jgi:(S)-3,5-dihydroxyphenylglycine transaminase
MLLGAGGRASALNRDTSAYYGRAMATTLAHLEAAFPAERRAELGVRWNTPSGGFFLVVDVPFVADNAALIRSAQRHEVIWTPMSYFYPAGGGTRRIRLSVSYLGESEIAEGVHRLAGFIEDEIARSR